MGIYALPENIVISFAYTNSKIEKGAYPQNPAFSTGVLWKCESALQKPGIFPQKIVQRFVYGILKSFSCAHYTLFSTVC
jgi:hypothetical protein